MKRRGLPGGGWGRLAASGAFSLFVLALTPMFSLSPLEASAAAVRTVASNAVSSAPASGPQLATYAGAPAAGKPTDVAQQPYAVAVTGRYTFVADPANRVVRLLVGNTEQVFAGNGSLSDQGGDPADLTSSQLKGPYAVAIGHVALQGFQVTGFDVYIADTYAHQIRKVHVTVPPIDKPNDQLKTQISTLAGSGDFGFSGDGSVGSAALANATFNSPYGLAWDDQRQVLYVADTLNNRIRKIMDPVPPNPTAGPVPPLPAATLNTVLGPEQLTTPGALRVGLNHPRGLAVDSLGRLYIADTYNNVVRVYDPGDPTANPPRSVSLSDLAGSPGVAGYRGDGQQASKALLRQPAGVAVDAQGNVYIADTGNHIVRMVSPNGIIQTVAGTAGKPGRFGDGGPAALAELTTPMGVAVRPNGDVVIADTGNNLVRILEGTIASGPTHNIHTEAGNGTASFAGDGRLPAQAQFAGTSSVLSQLTSTPASAAVPAVTGVRYVLDTFNHAVRTYATADNDTSAQSVDDHDADDVSTLAGVGGVSALSTQQTNQVRLADPMGMALDPKGNGLYVADTFNNVVRRVDLKSHAATIVAGTAGTAGYSGDGGPATQATLSFPAGVAVDQAGDLFIADSYNGVVREVRGGRIYTVAGNGVLGFTGDGGAATQAGLYFPYGVTVDTATPPNLFITDSFDHRIRQVAAVSPVDAKTGKPMDAGAKNTISTVAGDGAEAFGDGAATLPSSSSAASAHFDRPWSSTLTNGKLLVADYLNQRLRQVDLNGGTVTTIAGTGEAGLADPSHPSDPAAGPTADSGSALFRDMNGPRAVSTLGDSGALLIADSLNNRVRWLGMTQAGIQRTQVHFDPTNLSGTSQAQSVAVTSTGSGLLVMGKVDLGADANNFILDPAKNTCAQARLEPGSSCNFQVAFQPRSPGDHHGSVVIPNDAIGGQQMVVLTGQATAALVSLTPPAVAIYQPVNGTATPTTITLRNNGDGPLSIESIGLENGSKSDFSQSNNCPSVMLVSSTCQITIMLNQIASTDTNARTDTLIVRDDAAGNPVTTQTVPLTGALAQPAAAFNRQGLAFAQNVGTNSAPETFTLKNSGQVPLHLSSIHEDGDFAQTNNCPPALAPGASCAISVVFVPSTLGERDGYIVVASDSPDSPQRIQVMGVATMPSAQLAPGRLNFTGNVGTVSALQSVTLANRGDGPLTIGAISATGDFKAQPACPSVLLPGTSCSVGIAFTPHASGTRRGSLVISDDSNVSPGSQQSVALMGTAYQPIASLSTGSMSISSNLGGSRSQALTLANTGDGPLTVRSISIGGAASGDFVQSGNCLRTIQPGASCGINVTFSPHGYGARNATLTLFDDAAGGAQVVALRGTGTAPRPLLSASYLNFGGDAVGNLSQPQSVVLFNAGNGPLSIGGITSSGPDFVMGTTCGPSLAAGASCRITVTFAPQTMGPRSGIVTVTDSAGVQRFTLSGVGT